MELFNGIIWRYDGLMIFDISNIDINVGFLDYGYIVGIIINW